MNRLKPRKRVVVTIDTMQGSRTYQGVLLHRLWPWTRWVRLANTNVETDEGGFTDARGIGHLPARRVLFVQVLPS